MLSNTTLYRITSLCLLLVVNGVFGVDGDEVKSVSVTEGDSVTLHTNFTEIQQRDYIVWMFGPKEIRIAELYKQSIDMFHSNKIFENQRLLLDNQTGSVTIRNIRNEHSGLYKLQIRSDRGNSDKRFNVNVYAPLSIPVISSNSSNCSSSSSSSVSKYVLLCSVLNVRDVSLSWYKGNSLLSSISVSDLNIRLSLSLEVDYQDTNTYSCVVKNPIRNQTRHLNITHLCQPCPGSVYEDINVK
ncbi:CD48 antigen [Misgurnus anguillicaudatus]|uniref:CD48 antigen n=1 Tax=Misgurnus anguillicaudatus TaxID=75329 RepID=UPI003CCF0BEB